MTDKWCHISESILWENVPDQTMADVLSKLLADMMRAYTNAEKRMAVNNGTFESLTVDTDENEIELILHYTRPFTEKEILEQTKAKLAQDRVIENERLAQISRAKVQIRAYLEAYPELKGTI